MSSYNPEYLEVVQNGPGLELRGDGLRETKEERKR